MDPPPENPAVAPTITTTNPTPARLDGLNNQESIQAEKTRNPALSTTSSISRKAPSASAPTARNVRFQLTTGSPATAKNSITATGKKSTRSPSKPSTPTTPLKSALAKPKQPISGQLGLAAGRTRRVTIMAEETEQQIYDREYLELYGEDWRVTDARKSREEKKKKKAQEKEKEDEEWNSEDEASWKIPDPRFDPVLNAAKMEKNFQEFVKLNRDIAPYKLRDLISVDPFMTPFAWRKEASCPTLIPKFRKIPSSATKLIWKYALPQEPRVVAIHQESGEYLQTGGRDRFAIQTFGEKLPVTLRVNRESRGVTKEVYKQFFGSINNKPQYFDPNYDALHLWGIRPDLFMIFPDITAEFAQIAKIAIHGAGLMEDDGTAHFDRLAFFTSAKTIIFEKPSEGADEKTKEGYHKHVNYACRMLVNKIATIERRAREKKEADAKEAAELKAAELAEKRKSALKGKSPLKGKPLMKGKSPLEGKSPEKNKEVTGSMSAQPCQKLGMVRSASSDASGDLKRRMLPSGRKTVDTPTELSAGNSKTPVLPTDATVKAGQSSGTTIIAPVFRTSDGFTVAPNSMSMSSSFIDQAIGNFPSADVKITRGPGNTSLAGPMKAQPTISNATVPSEELTGPKMMKRKAASKSFNPCEVADIVKVHPKVVRDVAPKNDSLKDAGPKKDAPNTIAPKASTMGLGADKSAVVPVKKTFTPPWQAVSTEKMTKIVDDVASYWRFQVIYKKSEDILEVVIDASQWPERVDPLVKHWKWNMLKRRVFPARYTGPLLQLQKKPRPAKPIVAAPAVPVPVETVKAITAGPVQAPVQAANGKPTWGVFPRPQQPDNYVPRYPSRLVAPYENFVAMSKPAPYISPYGFEGCFLARAKGYLAPFPTTEYFTLPPSYISIYTTPSQMDKLLGRNTGIPAGGVYTGEGSTATVASRTDAVAPPVATFALPTDTIAPPISYTMQWLAANNDGLAAKGRDLTDTAPVIEKTEGGRKVPGLNDSPRLPEKKVERVTERSHSVLPVTATGAIVNLPGSIHGNGLPAGGSSYVNSVPVSPFTPRRLPGQDGGRAAAHADQGISGGIARSAREISSAVAAARALSAGMAGMSSVINFGIRPSRAARRVSFVSEGDTIDADDDDEDLQ